jgi:hypothetical protein
MGTLNGEQRLEAAKHQLATKRNAMAKAQGRYEDALNHLMVAYGYTSVQEAQAGHDKLMQEIPLMETKLNNLLNQAEEVLRGTEAGTGTAADSHEVVGRQRSSGAVQGRTRR